MTGGPCPPLAIVTSADVRKVPQLLGVTRLRGKLKKPGGLPAGRGHQSEGLYHLRLAVCRPPGSRAQGTGCQPADRPENKSGVELGVWEPWP